MKDYNGSKGLKALESPNDLLLVSIIDSGTGIKEDDLEKLFMMFGFIDTTKEINTQGIGLGLNISKEIVEQFGGFI
jgi:signal transduction histidine kinase